MRTINQLVQEYSLRFSETTDDLKPDLYGEIMVSFQSDVAPLSGSESDIEAGLSSLLSDSDGLQVDLWIIAADMKPSQRYVPALCAILSIRDRYIQHEWVADNLRKLRNPDSIDALQSACSFDIKSDPARALACLCLGALFEIDTPRSWAAIRSELNSPWPEVRAEAQRLLELGPDKHKKTRPDDAP